MRRIVAEFIRRDRGAFQGSRGLYTYAMAEKRFTAYLERSNNNLGWTVARIPFDAAKLWAKRGQIRVRGVINSFEFRATLFPDGKGNHYLLVNKKMQKGAAVRAGDKANFSLEPDVAARPIVVPP